MFLGHVGSGTETNLTKNGFSGCIQGFVIGDEEFNLEEAAMSLNPDEKYGNMSFTDKRYSIRSTCIIYTVYVKIHFKEFFVIPVQSSKVKIDIPILIKF